MFRWSVKLTEARSSRGGNVAVGVVPCTKEAVVGVWAMVKSEVETKIAWVKTTRSAWF